MMAAPGTEPAAAVAAAVSQSASTTSCSDDERALVTSMTSGGTTDSSRFVYNRTFAVCDSSLRLFHSAEEATWWWPQ